MRVDCDITTTTDEDSVSAEVRAEARNRYSDRLRDHYFDLHRQLKGAEDSRQSAAQLGLDPRLEQALLDVVNDKTRPNREAEFVRLTLMMAV